MAKLRVTSPDGYNHYWTPAGAHTSFPAGFEGTVKGEVLAAAIAAGKGEEIKPVKKAEDEPGRDN